MTPLGNDAETTWRALLQGKSGIDVIKAFDPSPFPVRIAGEVKDFDPATVVSPKKARGVDRAVLFSIAAAREALADAGVNGYSADRVGVVLGSCIGGFNQLMQQYDVLKERGPDRVSPAFIAHILVD